MCIHVKMLKKRNYQEKIRQLLLLPQTVRGERRCIELKFRNGFLSLCSVVKGHISVKCLARSYSLESVGLNRIEAFIYFSSKMYELNYECWQLFVYLSVFVVCFKVMICVISVCTLLLL